MSAAQPRDHRPGDDDSAWLPGTVGDRFRGSDRSGLAARWSRRCEVEAADPAGAFAFRTVPERLDVSRRDSTIRRDDPAPVTCGTRVTHSYGVTALPLTPLRALTSLPTRGECLP